MHTDAPVEGDDVALTAVGAAHEVVRAGADEYSVPAVAQCRDAVGGRSDEVALDRVGIRPRARNTVGMDGDAIPVAGDHIAAVDQDVSCVVQVDPRPFPQVELDSPGEVSADEIALDR